MSTERRPRRGSSLLVIALLGCGATAPVTLPATTPAATPRPRRASEVHVDRRIELVSIVMRLAGAEEYRMAPATGYVADVDRAFAPFANHPAITMTRALREQHGIAFDAPIGLAIRLDDRFELRDADGLRADDERWQGVDLAAYTAQLRAFATAARLDVFLAAHAAHFRAVEGALRTRLDAEHPVDWFDATFGVRARARYVVVPGMLEGGGNYGPSTTLPDGTLEMYQVLGLGNVDAEGLPKIDDETVDLLIHEMAHSYVNPVIDRHQTALARAGGQLFPLVEAKMTAQAYGTWLTMFRESGVRAVTVLYIRDHRGALAAADAARREVRNGFVWTPELEALLQRYRRDRARYPTLDAFMPEIIGLFDRVAVRYAHGLPAGPFDGPLDAVFEPAHDLVVVSPAGSDDGLASYLGKIHDKLFAAVPMVVASDHTYRDHPNHGLVAYGSPQTSPVVADVLARAGITVDRETITIGTRRFTGPSLVLIACWTRPDDANHGVAVYAAGTDRDLVDVHSIRHGGQDWLVARRTTKGFVVVDAGDFPRSEDGRWRLP